MTCRDIPVLEPRRLVPARLARARIAWIIRPDKAGQGSALEVGHYCDPLFKPKGSPID